MRSADGRFAAVGQDQVRAATRVWNLGKLSDLIETAGQDPSPVNILAGSISGGGRGLRHLPGN